MRVRLNLTYKIFKTSLEQKRDILGFRLKTGWKEKRVSEEVQEMMLTLASSNFFTGEPEKIPSDVYFNYYQRLFSTNKPVTYIEGGWQALINEFVRVIEENGGELKTKAKVTTVQTEEDQVVAVETAKRNF